MDANISTNHRRLLRLRGVVGLWVSMAGLAGIGKSTLAGEIAVTLRRRHFPVDVFGEEELFSRPQFARVADGFRTRRYASPREFETAYQDWLSTLAEGTIAVMDWNPAGMAGDLPWAIGDGDEFRRHLEVVRMLADGKVLILHLQTSAKATIDRASRQRGDEWVSRSDEVARAAGHHQANPADRLIAEATRHAAQTQDELRVAADAGWRVRRVDATDGPTVVHDRVIALIEAAKSPT
jgi:hypothetical protein